MTKLYTKNTWTDEVLAGNERYNILDDGGTPINSTVQINLDTSVAVAGSPVTASRMNNIENGIDDLDDLLNSIRADATELTIASGAITLTQSNHKLQPESGTADSLSTISGTVAGQSGVLIASNAGTDTITILHNDGNISCMGGTSISLSTGCVFWYSDGTTVYISGGGGGGGAATIGVSGNVLNAEVGATPLSGGDYDGNLLVGLWSAISGNSPSPSEPVIFRCGQQRQPIIVTSGLFFYVTNANVFGLGTTEFAGKDAQLFIYLGTRMNDSYSPFVGASRIPFGRHYKDFSHTSTNPKYFAYSGAEPYAEDEVILIGRVNVQNSGASSYNWVQPDVTDVRSYPIYETDYLTWLPTYSASSPMTFDTVTTDMAVYKIKGDEMFVSLDIYGTTSSAGSFALQASPPIPMNTTKMPGIPYLPCYIIDNGDKPGGYVRYAIADYDGIQFTRTDEAYWALTSGQTARGSLVYAI